MEAPLVSVIMPVFNSAPYLSDSIGSVLNQTFRNIELICVDDNSSDESVSIIKGFALLDKRVKLLTSKTNSGAAVARNRGIDTSVGKYVAFLDSDDIWFPSKLDCQIKFMLENNYSFVFSAYERIDEQGLLIGRVGVPDKVSYTDLLKLSSIGCLTVIYDAQVLGRINMPLIRKRQDFGLWLRLLKITPFAYGMNDYLAAYRVRGDSISANKLAAAKYTWRLYRDHEKLPFFIAAYFFMNYALNGFLRNKLPTVARLIGVLR